MSRPVPAVRARYDQETTAARAADDPDLRWSQPESERARILSQPHAWPYTCDYVAMLALTVRQRDRREAPGQVVRIIVAAPGSPTGR